MPEKEIGGLPVSGRKSAAVLRTRLAIVVAAQQVFADQGTLASIEDVASNAGVSISTLYKHFANKEDLVTAAFSYALKSLESWAADQTSSEIDPLSRIVFPMRLFVRAHKTHPALARLVANNANEANLRLVTLGESLTKNLENLNSVGVMRVDNLPIRVELLLSAVVHILQKSVFDSKFTSKSADQAISIALQMLGLDVAEAERLVASEIPNDM